MWLKSILHSRKKMSGLDKYIIFSFTSIIIYTIIEHILVIKTGIILDLLTSLFYGVFGGEILMCALIKKLKLKQSNKKEEENDAVG